MSWDDRRLAVLALTVLAAFAVLASTAMLVADVAVARGGAASAARRIEALEERARTDAGAAVELEAERKLQTETSLRREKSNRRLGWVLLAAGGVFLTGAKWLVVRPGDAPPSRGAELAPHLEAIGQKDAYQAPLQEQPIEPEVDVAFVDDLVARLGRGREAAIPVLQAIQEHYRYLPEEALRHLCELTEITPSQVAGTASFYARFRRSPVGEHLVRLCHGTACHVAGVAHVDQELRRRLRVPAGADTDPSWRFTLEPVACLGCCSLAPVMMVGEETAGHLTPATAGDRLVATVSRLPSSGATEGT